MNSSSEWTVEVTRGSVVESAHQVVLSVVDAEGKILGCFGNTKTIVFPRSAIKMLQALPLVETGAASHFQLSPKELALACASHEGENFHVQAVKDWAQRIGVEESDLACGPHEPVHRASADEMKKSGLTPNRWMNNCSGKHLGFLTTAKFLGEEFRGYHQAHHPIQKRVRRALEETLGSSLTESQSGIDGCGIPTYAAPLESWARGLSSFLPQSPGGKESSRQTLVKAFQSHPEFVSGSENFCSSLVRASEGQILVKSGAEGIYCGLFLQKGIAFALKVIDGSPRGAQRAVASLIEKTKSLSDEKQKSLPNFFRPEIKNTRNESVGEIRLKSESFDLF